MAVISGGEIDGLVVIAMTACFVRAALTIHEVS